MRKNQLGVRGLHPVAGIRDAHMQGGTVAEQSNDTKTMFNKDGKMDSDGAKNVLKILDSYSANVKGKGSSIDLSKTYTIEFVDKLPAK